MLRLKGRIFAGSTVALKGIILSGQGILNLIRFIWVLPIQELLDLVMNIS